jgi:transposase
MEWIEVQVVYEKEVSVSVSVSVSEVGVYQAGIDVGLDNLLSVVSDNSELKSFIVSGKELKSYNRWWNKKKAEVQSHIDMVLNLIEEEKNEEKRRSLEKHYWWLKKYLWNLCKARDRKLNTWMHQITRRLADLLYETGHRVVYIGRNAVDKNGIPFSKVVN